MESFQVAPHRALLDRNGSDLQARSRSAAGDKAALELLSFLQVTARDSAGLPASDELGWRRYRLAKYAASRALGTPWDDNADTKAQGAARLNEALRDFPQDALLRRLRFEHARPPAEELQRALLDWILAEYSGLSRNGEVPTLGTPTTTLLRSLVLTLQKTRSANPAAR